MVDLEIIEKHLALNERHVEEAARHVSNQRRIIDHLQEIGCSTGIASKLLATFEANFSIHKEERDRLLLEKEQASSGTVCPRAPILVLSGDSALTSAFAGSCVIAVSSTRNRDCRAGGMFRR